jgi:predicted Rossmann fold nucleotide-binding protein DprA/Smf involved in DNA uptake
LEAAVAALDGIASNGAGATRAVGSQGPGRPRRRSRTVAATAATKAKRSRAGRPKGGGRRSSEALEAVAKQPGVTIAELAARMGIKQNYLYRVLPALEQEGKVRKEGRGWHPSAPNRGVKP